MKLQKEAKSLHKHGCEVSFATRNIQLEKDKGKGMEYSKTLFALPNRRFTLFHASEHQGQVPSVINQAYKSELGIFIFSSKEGEFESGLKKDGYIRHHALLGKALGITTLICVVMKMSLSKWQKERYDFIKDTIVPYLENTCKYPKVEILPIDLVQNMNIDTRVPGKICEWYHGLSLLEILNDTEISPKNPTGPLRIPIVDKIHKKGQQYVCGRIESGTIIEDQEVTLMPSKKSFKIKEIYDLSDCRIPYAPAGENVKLKVTMIENQDISIGNIICNNRNYNQVGNLFQAKLYILDLPETKKQLTTGYEVVMHLHYSVEIVQIVEVETLQNSKTGKMVNANFLRIKEIGIVKIKAKNVICFESHDFMPALGSFTLRDLGKIIAYGEVLKLESLQAPTSQEKAQLEELEEENEAERTQESKQEKPRKVKHPKVAPRK